MGTPSASQVSNISRHTRQASVFDCVTVAHVLSVTPDPQRLVRELRRVMQTVSPPVWHPHAQAPNWTHDGHSRPRSRSRSS